MGIEEEYNQILKDLDEFAQRLPEELRPDYYLGLRTSFDLGVQCDEEDPKTVEFRELFSKKAGLL